MLAIETLLGALTGYFTNDIAIRQLFSKNGVVVRERAQFTELIVDVLKDKIIDADTIEALRDRPEMVTFFEEFVINLLGEALPSALFEKSLADYDGDGALQEMVERRLDAVALEGVELNVALVYGHLDKLVQSERFQQALLQSFKKIATLSLQDLGLAASVEKACGAFLAMDDEAWQGWIQHQAHLMSCALDGQAPCKIQEQQSLQEVLNIDGETVVQKLEAYFGLDMDPTASASAFVTQYTHVLEQLYVFMARVLPEVLQNHLPALLDAVLPMLVEDHEWIEQMVLESIDACNLEGNIILSAAQGYAQKFFMPDEDGNHWLTKLQATLSIPEEREALCVRFADFLCGLVMKQIDEWRRMDLANDTDVERVHARYVMCRTWLVRGFDAYLAQPVQGNVVHRVLLKGVIAVGATRLAQQVSAAQMHQWCNNTLMQWCTQPLETLILNEAQQQQLVKVWSRWWHENGLEWLAQQNLSEATLKKGAKSTVQWLFEQPIHLLLARCETYLPYERLADVLRVAFFGRLRDFLAGMTKEQLDSLSHDEIREVVLDMIGREMRPLAYLGGGIGAAAGVVTGAAMQATGVSVDGDQMALLLAARSGMYGAVGYGTNVMAVKGLFWPYKKTLGMQGLICKNQTRFASKMKSMAESYIINDDIWMQQVAQVAARFESHYEDFLHQGLHLMKENRESALRPYVEMIAQDLPHQACKVALEEEQVVNLLQRYVSQKAAAWFNWKNVAYLANSADLLHRSICQMAMKEAKDASISNRLVQSLQQVTADSWVHMGNDLLSKWHFPAQEDFYQTWWSRLLPYYRDLPKHLFAFSADIAAGLGRFIMQRLSFPLQLAYRMAGGDQQIERVVKYLISNKLPEYVAAREERLQNILVTWAHTQFAGNSALESGLSLSEAQGQWMSDWLGDLNIEHVHQHVLSLFVLLEKMPKAFLQEWTKVGVRAASPLLESAHQQWQAFDMHGALKWQEMVQCAEPLLEEIRQQVFKGIALNNMLSISAERLWALMEAAVNLSDDDKKAILTTTQQLWLDVAPAFWQTIGQRGRVLLMLIDIPTLTRDRICALSPQELEVMVRAIAQPYFTRVERMGWLGAVVAVPATMISMMLGGM